MKKNSHKKHIIFIFLLVVSSLHNNHKTNICVNQLCRTISTRKTVKNFDWGFVVIPFKSHFKLSFIGKWFADKYIIFCLASKAFCICSTTRAHIYWSFFPSYKTKSESQPASQSANSWILCAKNVCVTTNANVCCFCSVSPSTCCFTHNGHLLVFHQKQQQHFILDD